MKFTDDFTQAGPASMASLDAASAEGLEMIGRLSTAMMEFMGRSSAEAVEFITARFQQDAEMQQRLLACHSLDELSRVQTEFVSHAIEQYTQETGKMVKLGSEAMAELLHYTRG